MVRARTASASRDDLNGVKELVCNPSWKSAACMDDPRLGVSWSSRKC